MRRDGVIAFAAKLPICTMAMEACCGVHHMWRSLAALGRDVRLMSPEYVRHYVKAQKNNDRDAEAIAEAAKRPTMRFVNEAAPGLKVRDYPMQRLASYGYHRKIQIQGIGRKDLLPMVAVNRGLTAASEARAIVIFPRLVPTYRRRDLPFGAREPQSSRGELLDLADTVAGAAGVTAPTASPNGTNAAPLR